MTLYFEGGQITVPTQAREVYDVSGAGDTVIAILATMLATGMTVEEAVRTANRAAGVVVGKLGTATVSYEAVSYTHLRAHDTDRSRGLGDVYKRQSPTTSTSATSSPACVTAPLRSPRRSSIRVPAPTRWSTTAST